MFRWGVLSTAKIGWEHVIPAIVSADNGILAGLASRDQISVTVTELSCCAAGADKSTQRSAILFAASMWDGIWPESDFSQ